MAVLHAGITARMHGKLAGVVGQPWKGIPTIREAVPPSNPRSEKQLVQRRKYAVTIGMARTLSRFAVNRFNLHTFRKETPINQMVRLNINRINLTHPLDGFICYKGWGTGSVQISVDVEDFALYSINVSLRVMRRPNIRPYIGILMFEELRNIWYIQDELDYYLPNPFNPNYMRSWDIYPDAMASIAAGTSIYIAPIIINYPKTTATTIELGMLKNERLEVLGDVTFYRRVLPAFD